MNQSMTARVGADGTLTLSLGAAYADKLVSVSVSTLPEMTQEEWQRFIAATAGKWEGEFERTP